jgi:hypothetical protein
MNCPYDGRSCAMLDCNDPPPRCGLRKIAAMKLPPREKRQRITRLIELRAFRDQVDRELKEQSQ